MLPKLRSFILVLGAALSLFAVPFWVIYNSTEKRYQRDYKKVIVEWFKENESIDLSDKDIPAQLDLATVCAKWDGQSEFIYLIVEGKYRIAVDSKFCKNFKDIQRIGTIVYKLAVATLIFSLLLIFLLLALGFIARGSRRALFLLFRPGLYIAQLSAVILVMANTAIGVLYYYNMSRSSNHVRQILDYAYLAVGICIVLAALIMVIYSTFSSLQVKMRTVWGKRLAKTDHRELWNFIESISHKLGALPPDTVILGMEPTFYVTETPFVLCNGEVLEEISEKALYISLPFCMVLSREELAAIIGHEMGHFVGEDTQWSRKFYPIYRRSSEMIYALEGIAQQSEITYFACIPSYIFMYLFMHTFERTEKKMSRDRELQADSLGARVASKEALASALVKTCCYAEVWNITMNQVQEQLVEDKHCTNIPSIFQSHCRALLEDIVSGTVPNFTQAALIKQTMTHPTDTHPPLIDRLKALGISLNDLDKRVHALPIESVNCLIAQVQRLEEELTSLEYLRMFVEVTPEERDQ